MWWKVFAFVVFLVCSSVTCVGCGSHQTTIRVCEDDLQELQREVESYLQVGDEVKINLYESIMEHWGHYPYVVGRVQAIGKGHIVLNRRGKELFIPLHNVTAITMRRRKSHATQTL